MKLAQRIIVSLCAVAVLCSTLAVCGAPAATMAVTSASAAATSAEVTHAVEFSAVYTGTTNTLFSIGFIANTSADYVRIYDGDRSRLLDYVGGSFKTDRWYRSRDFRLSAGTHTILVVPVGRDGREGPSRSVRITVTTAQIAEFYVSQTTGTASTRFVFSYKLNEPTKKINLYYKVNDGAYSRFAYQTTGAKGWYTYTSTGFTFPKGKITVMARPVDSAGVENTSNQRTLILTVK